MTKPSFKKETRFALVLYGGVSLAVYIYGVSNEFFNAVRGRRVYGLLKILFDTDIIVDIISGTSAGGINGIFLANALANEKEFGSTADLWRKKGGLAELLRGVNDPLGTYKSLLNSEGYYFPSLYQAFKNLNSTQNSITEYEDIFVSKITNLDLFVTGTNLEGNFFFKIDDSQNKIEYKDHRNVFLLKYRDLTGYRLNQFEENNDNYIKGIAKLAQITSCFPFAFAPVHVHNELAEDKLLTYWGGLNGSNYFVDGGVLDNKPFGHTIKAIFSKKAERIVERHLIFVEPDPVKEQKKEDFSEPNILKVVKSSLLSIPGYESISDDLNMIIERNLKINQINEFTENFSFINSDCCKDGKDEIYIRARLNYNVNKAIDLVINNNSNLNNIDGAEKLKIAQRLNAYLLKKIEASVEYYIKNNNGGNSGVINIREIFEKMDIYYRLRRIYSIIYKLYEIVEKDSKETGKYNKELMRLWKNLNTISSFYEIVKSGIEKRLSNLVIENESEEKNWDLVLSSLRNILESLNYSDIIFPDLIFFEDLQELRGNLSKIKERLNIINNRLFDLPSSEFVSIFKLFDELEYQLIHNSENKSLSELKNFYNNFIKYDCKVFPLEVMADIYEKDIIKFHRFSPFDCQKGFSQKTAYEKITGNELHHFGAFLKRSWRSNDIMWGRIDSVGGLISIFFSNNKFFELLSNASDRIRLKNLIFNPDGLFQTEFKIRNFFPNANNYTCIIIQNLLKNLILNYDSYEGNSDLLNKDIKKLENLLIETEQLEVFKEEFKNVATDAIEEQFIWNNEQSLTPKEENIKEDKATVPWRFKSLSKYYDKFVSQNFASDNIDKFIDNNCLKEERALPKNTKFGEYLTKTYDVGSEKLSQDIPYVVILHLISRALLIIKNIILNLLSQCKKKVPQKFMFKLLVEFPLKTFYHLTSIMQRSFGFGMGLFVGLNLLALVLITLRLIFVQGFSNPVIAEIFFSVIPLIILVGTIFILYHNKKIYRTINLIAVFLLVGQLVVYFISTLQEFYNDYRIFFVSVPIGILVLSVLLMVVKRFFFKAKW